LLLSIGGYGAIGLGLPIFAWIAALLVWYPAGRGKLALPAESGED
jgi:hypothetical protein